MTRFKIRPYRRGSRSVSALRNFLPRCSILRTEDSRYTPREGDVIINWGNSNTNLFDWEAPGDLYVPVLNPPETIQGASNKLEFFNLMSGADLTPEFWTNPEEIPDEAFPVVCRTILSGHSGAGIVISGTRGELARAPLYVRYVKKKEEYRIHLGKDKEGRIEVFSIQRKARRRGEEPLDWQVRSHRNGFVFIRDGVNPPEDVLRKAYQTFVVSGLDFGAVDVIWNEHYGRAYVLEINTAPGLEGTTVEHYSEFFIRNYFD
jgi:glutathione synthase/RimK-type ligase-like ATP-grasp enzyme